MTKKKTKEPANKTLDKKTFSAEKTPVKNALARKGLGVDHTSVARVGTAADKKGTPLAFSLDDVEALVASRKKEIEETPVVKVEAPVRLVKKVIAVDDQPVVKRVLGAATLADILGFSSGSKKKVTDLEEDSIPKKWHKYYKLLVELRQHVSSELDMHTADTLKHSTREDTENSYGSHMADADTDTFDHDFALSLVSNEQDALNEIEEAILRIKDGTYGICEVTGKVISKARLAAVPFARYSVEGQAEYEKNKRRKVDRTAGGVFADSSDAPKIVSDEDE
jgi:RNA polymerase-binding transcription factor DksA